MSDLADLFNQEKKDVSGTGDEEKPSENPAVQETSQQQGSDVNFSILDSLWEPEGEAKLVSPYVKCHIYGDPGSGKTVLAATAPKPLILDVENSSEVLDDWPDLKARCKILPCRSWEDFNQIFQALWVNHPKLADRETIVIDTMTEFSLRNLDNTMNTTALNRASPFMASKGDYNINGTMLRRLAITFRDLNKNLIFLSHRREHKMDSGKIIIRPDLPDKLAGTLLRVIGLQGFLTSQTETDDKGVENFQNWLITRQTEYIEAKCRYNSLPAIMPNPNFQQIIEAKQHSIHEGEVVE